MSTQPIVLSLTDRDAPNPDDLLNEKQAARRLGLAPQTLASWRTSKAVKLPYILLGGSVRYRPSDIEEFLKARTVGEDGVVPAGVRRRRGGPGRPAKPKGRARKQRGGVR